MSSFYGGGGSTVIVNVTETNDGSAFTSLTGTDESPIVLNTLDYGNYMISGIYSYTAEDSDREVDYPLYVAIIEDSLTGDKIAKFETVEGGTFYINLVTFDDAEGYQMNKLSIGADGSTSSLPIATPTSLGVVMIGDGLQITNAGVASVDFMQLAEDADTSAAAVEAGTEEMTQEEVDSAYTEAHN